MQLRCLRCQPRIRTLTHSCRACTRQFAAGPWSEQFWSVSHSDSVLLPLSRLCHTAWLGLQWPSAGASAGDTQLTVPVHASVGNAPSHSRCQCTLKREFILRSHPLLPPEGLWLLKLLGRRKKGACCSPRTSVRRLQEDGQQRESVCGGSKEGETERGSWQCGAAQHCQRRGRRATTPEVRL